VDKLTLVESNTFIVSDMAGNIKPDTSEGLFFDDTRFLSDFTLKINGNEPEPLAAKAISNYAGSIYAANAVTADFTTRTLSLIRDRFIDQGGFHENMKVSNYDQLPRDINIEIAFDTDFADIFEVKRGGRITGHDKVLESAPEIPLIFSHWHNGIFRRTTVRITGHPIIEGRTACFVFQLAPHETWETCLNIDMVTEAKGRPIPKYVCAAFDLFVPQPRQEEQRWAARIPEIDTDNDRLHHLYRRSALDLAALRLKVGEENVPAAGVPWFMTVFGRDSIITALQVLPMATDLAEDVLRVMARFQGREVNRFREEEPGKIIHEMRFGELARTGQKPHARYYGAVDTTPLFIILLGQVYRWTGNKRLVSELLPAAESALSWIDAFGDRDGDGFVEYQRQSAEGLLNQGWKDSADAILFADGSPAQAPIALAEVQGYVYKAKMMMADLLQDFGDRDRAGRLRQEAAELKKRFNEAFWVPSRGYFAMALDGDKRQVDCMASNQGHCLWSGIIDEARAPAVVNRLMAADTFSGWGVRTMSAGSAGYNPLSYHNGSIWPHDNSIIAAGLAAYGFYEPAHRIILGMIDAASEMPGYRFPELFAGFERRPSGFPAPYPTASSPQAWATGTVFMFIQILLGVPQDPSISAPVLQAHLPPTIDHLEINLKP
jgi:glycogen debranching enzyme